MTNATAIFVIRTDAVTRVSIEAPVDVWFVGHAYDPVQCDDLQEIRRMDWASALVTWVDNPALQGVLRSMGQHMMGEDVYSTRQLNALEERLFGDIRTLGTFPKRARFWRFVFLASIGKTPRDLKDVPWPAV